MSIESTRNEDLPETSSATVRPAQAGLETKERSMRTKVYNSIVELLADGEWHPIDDLWKVTTEPADWLKILARDAHFEYEVSQAKIRLVSTPPTSSKTW